MPERARVVALLGAESTGKTDLARALAETLARRTGLRVSWVPEHLRTWCDAKGRTPLRHEQHDIARAQTQAIDDAARDSDLVIADTTALMTAVYSRFVFGDESLDAAAVAAHRRCTVTLVTALDLPWLPDGLQRDGPHAREPVDALLHLMLRTHGIGHAGVHGLGAERVHNALAACASLGLAWAATAAPPIRGPAPPTRPLGR